LSLCSLGLFSTVASCLNCLRLGPRAAFCVVAYTLAPSSRACLPCTPQAGEVRRTRDLSFCSTPGLVAFAFRRFAPNAKRALATPRPFCNFAASLGWPELLLPAWPRLAPRERCVQLCFAVKPGGVIRPLRSSMSSHLASTPRLDRPQEDFLAISGTRAYRYCLQSITLWIF